MGSAVNEHTGRAMQYKQQSIQQQQRRQRHTLTRRLAAGLPPTVEAPRLLLTAVPPRCVCSVYTLSPLTRLSATETAVIGREGGGSGGREW